MTPNLNLPLPLSTHDAGIVKLMRSRSVLTCYDDVIKNTKREVAKQRKRIRTDLSLSDNKDEEIYDQYSAQHINAIDHYSLYLPMFKLLYSNTQPVTQVKQYDGDYHSLRNSFNTYREAYCCLVDTLCHK